MAVKGVFSGDNISIKSFHLPVQKWFVANGLIVGDYTASEEIVGVLGLDG